MAAKLQISDEALYLAYSDPTRTIAQIAADVGVHPVVLSRLGVRAADRLGRPRRTRHSRVAPETLERLVADVRAGVPMDQAAERAGVSRQHAGYLARRAGVGPRDGRRYSHAIDLDDPDEGTLRWLGAVLGDGANTGHELHVHTGGTDPARVQRRRAWLEALAAGTGNTRPISERPARNGSGTALILSVAGRQLCARAAELGIVVGHQRATDLTLDDALASSRGFWRGYVEANGWVGRTRRVATLRLEVIGRPTVLAALSGHLREHVGAASRIYPGSGRRSPRMYVARDDVDDALTWLGLD